MNYDDQVKFVKSLLLYVCEVVKEKVFIYTTSIGEVVVNDFNKVFDIRFNINTSKISFSSSEEENQFKERIDEKIKFHTSKLTTIEIEIDSPGSYSFIYVRIKTGIELIKLHKVFNSKFHFISKS
jgi:hypothetical protein